MNHFGHQHKFPREPGLHRDNEFDQAHHHHLLGAQRSQRRLLAALLITGGFGIFELVGGWWAGSLALISDAGHMFTDAGALLLALLANHIGQRPATYGKTYGYARAEVIGALLNGLTMLILVGWICFEAIHRLLHPNLVNGLGVMVIAVIGLGVNIASAWQLGHDQENLNTRAAFIHVLGDLLGSVAAILAGVVIYYTGWQPIDPLLSMLVCLLILRSTWALLRQSLNVLMEGVPEGLDLHEIGHAIAAEEGVMEVHDLHVWHISLGRVALSAHLLIHHHESWPTLLARICHLLKTRYRIEHVTLQPTWLPPPSKKGTPPH